MKTLQTSLTDLIVTCHRFYAETKNPLYREIATTLGKVKPDTSEEDWQRKVNAGAKAQGLPLPYPLKETGDSTK